MSDQTGPNHHYVIPGERVPSDPWNPEGPSPFAFVSPTKEGIRLVPRRPHAQGGANSDLMMAMMVRGLANGHFAALEGSVGRGGRELYPNVWRTFTRQVLVVPHSERWQEAASTALLGNWCAPLWRTGCLLSTAVEALRAEARALHRQLVPVWRRRTRHGRVLSLDAALGDGLSLYDLVAADIDLLARLAGGVFEDERLNAVLRGLDDAERQVVFAYAEGEGTTWAEAAAAAGATDPQAFGERVRRKAQRLAAEQRRRLEARRSTE